MVATKEYSGIMFIPAKKSIIDRVQPAKIPRWCLWQLLGASWEKDSLNIPEQYVSIKWIHFGEHRTERVQR